MSAGIPPDRARAIVDRFARRRIAVLGDLVCDEFVHGDIARISREAPVLILEQTHTVLVPGGGGNAVANLRALDAVPVPVGVVGADDAGERLLRRFRDAAIRVEGVRREAGYETPTKSRILAGGVHTRRQQIVRVDRGQRHGELDAAITRRIATRLIRGLRGAEGLLVADYGYGAAPPSVLRAAIRGRRVAFPVTVDSRGRVASFRGVTACTPNQEELEASAAEPPLRNERALDRAGRALLRRTRNRAVLVTRGAKGMILFERDRPRVAIPAFGSGEVADVTGAGDTVIAVFTLALSAGATPGEAAWIANVAAGLVVMKYGTATISRRELVAAFRNGARR